MVNSIATYVPQRRKRKLHIGLFGYSRNFAEKDAIKLPRAISFCCSLYSIGIPPEVIGIDSLENSDFDYLKQDKNFINDMHDALQYSNPQLLFGLFPNIKEIIEEIGFQENKEHSLITSKIYRAVNSGNGQGDKNITKLITEAAKIRKFLG